MHLERLQVRQVFPSFSQQTSVPPSWRHTGLLGKTWDSRPLATANAHSFPDTYFENSHYFLELIYLTLRIFSSFNSRCASYSLLLLSLRSSCKAVRSPHPCDGCGGVCVKADDGTCVCTLWYVWLYPHPAEVSSASLTIDINPTMISSDVWFSQGAYYNYLLLVIRLVQEHTSIEEFRDKMILLFSHRLLQSRSIRELLSWILKIWSASPHISE